MTYLIRNTLRKDWALSLLLMTVFPLTMAAPAAPAAPATATPASGRMVFGKLDAAALGQIQIISQGILTAKGSEQVSAQEQAMLQSLHALSASLDQMANQTHMPILKLESSTPAADRKMERAVERASVEGKLRPHLESLATHVQTVQSMSQSLSDSEDEKQIRFMHLAGRAAAITHDVESALMISDDGERLARLTDLGKHLHSRTPAQWWAEQRDQARANGLPDPLPDSPTLTTEVRHRTGLDNLQNKAGR